MLMAGNNDVHQYAVCIHFVYFHCNGFLFHVQKKCFNLMDLHTLLVFSSNALDFYLCAIADAYCCNDASYENLPPKVVKELAKELKSLADAPPEGIRVLMNDDNLSAIYADIEGPGILIVSL
eukprot:Gb_06919 [translate_table: standard]